MMRRTIRPKDVQAAYGISRTSLYKLMAAGRVHSVAVTPRMRLISVDSLEALVREKEGM